MRMNFPAVTAKEWIPNVSSQSAASLRARHSRSDVSSSVVGRIGVLLAVSFVAWGVSQARAETQGLHAATEPILAHIERSYPHARQRFVDCPGNNRFTFDGTEGLICEFRVVESRKVIRGTAGVAPQRNSASWSVVGFHPMRPQPQKWQTCSLAGVDLTSQRPRRLKAFGTSCQNARFIAVGIGYRALHGGSLRLPRRFTESHYGTNTLGFVTNTFRCRGHLRVRQGNPNPYGYEIARCRTRFGDHVTYAFDQYS
jgi:hypothetical protein